MFGMSRVNLGSYALSCDVSRTPTICSDLASLVEIPKIMRPGTNQYFSECFLDRNHGHSIVW